MGCLGFCNKTGRQSIWIPIGFDKTKENTKRVLDPISDKIVDGLSKNINLLEPIIEKHEPWSKANEAKNLTHAQIAEFEQFHKSQLWPRTKILIKEISDRYFSYLMN